MIAQKDPKTSETDQRLSWVGASISPYRTNHWEVYTQSKLYRLENEFLSNFRSIRDETLDRSRIVKWLVAKHGGLPL